MRDFNNGGDLNVSGDLIVGDRSENIGKLLVNCTNEELLQERPFRKENLRLERNRKLKAVIPILGTAVIMFIGSALWSTFNGKSDMASVFLGIGSLIVGYAALKGVAEPNDFEHQEREALREIRLILKSRRVE